MEHLAVMQKKRGFIEKILNGQKTIESRWYMRKYAPWNIIARGESVYFKNSGEKVQLRADVSKVVQFSDLNQEKIRDILQNFGDKIGLENSKYFFETVKYKKYCILIFLKNVKEVSPFKINKKGFGAMASWICIESINKIKK